MNIKMYYNKVMQINKTTADEFYIIKTITKIFLNEFNKKATKTIIEYKNGQLLSITQNINNELYKITFENFYI